MKISLNLASQPFRRDRPMIVASTVLGVILTGMLILLMTLIFMERHQLADTHAEIARLEQEVGKLAREQQLIEGELRKPENAQVLERSLFLNSLAFKWIHWKFILILFRKIP